MATSTITLQIAGFPEALWVLRQALARLLRERAEAEASTYVGERLRVIAADFEAGTERHGEA